MAYTPRDSDQYLPDEEYAYKLKRCTEDADLTEFCEFLLGLLETDMAKYSEPPLAMLIKPDTAIDAALMDSIKLAEQLLRFHSGEEGQKVAVLQAIEVLRSHNKSTFLSSGVIRILKRWLNARSCSPSQVVIVPPSLSRLQSPAPGGKYYFWIEVGKAASDQFAHHEAEDRAGVFFLNQKAIYVVNFRFDRNLESSDAQQPYEFAPDESVDIGVEVVAVNKTTRTYQPKDAMEVLLPKDRDSGHPYRLGEGGSWPFRVVFARKRLKDRSCQLTSKYFGDPPYVMWANDPDGKPKRLPIWVAYRDATGRHEAGPVYIPIVCRVPQPQ